MIRKIMMAVAVMALVDSMNAATVEKAINITQRINITPDHEVAVLFIDLPSAGTWSVNGSLNLFLLGQDGARVYYASYLSTPTPFIDYQNGRTVFKSVVLGPDEGLAGRADEIVPLVGRRIVVAPGQAPKRVYLMVWVHQDEPVLTTVQTYGFAYAVLLGNF